MTNKANIKNAKETVAIIESVLKAAEDIPELLKKAKVSKEEAAWALGNINIIVDFYCDACNQTSEINYVSGEDKYVPVKQVDWSDVDSAIKAEEDNMARLTEIDKKCKRQNSILGRYISISVADGYAIYQIIAESVDEVFVTLCNGISDGYQDIILGGGDWIKKEMAVSFIKCRDDMEEYFINK